MNVRMHFEDTAFRKVDAEGKDTDWSPCLSSIMDENDYPKSTLYEVGL